MGAPGSSTTRERADDTSNANPSTRNKTGKTAATRSPADKQRQVLND